MTRHQSWSIPKHRKEVMIWTNRPELRERLRKTPQCKQCGKYQFRTQADARGFIAMILTPAPQPDDYQMRAYECPHGNGWHIGHDRTVAELLSGSPTTGPRRRGDLKRGRKQ